MDDYTRFLDDVNHSCSDILSIWVNYNDLTVLPHWNHGLDSGNHPQIAELFRLVKYYNLPGSMYYISQRISKENIEYPIDNPHQKIREREPRISPSNIPIKYPHQISP